MNIQRLNHVREVTSGLCYAFQPIISAISGECIGFEALLRGYGESSFSTAEELFDWGYGSGLLLELHNELFCRALKKFSTVDTACKPIMFYNTDIRVIEYVLNKHQFVIDTLFECGMAPDRICYEITEHHACEDYGVLTEAAHSYREFGIRLAIDDFGSGYAGYKLMYELQPDYIKIDRYYIQDIHKTLRKRQFVEHLSRLAHINGAKVIAEGVETAEEFSACRDLGCDYVQGYFIQRPSEDTAVLTDRYEVCPLAEGQRRSCDVNRYPLYASIQEIEPIGLDWSAEQILDSFRNEEAVLHVPVIGPSGEPLGILSESTMRRYVFSYHGISIFRNLLLHQGLEYFITRVLCIEKSSTIDSIMSIIKDAENTTCVMITENGRYAGILDTYSLLKIISERDIAVARDLNPLTKLPGNLEIERVLVSLLTRDLVRTIVCYFDFNWFKAFNDHYGFRLGDRIIGLFAQMLKRYAAAGDLEFIGHIGGDDFFVILPSHMIPHTKAHLLISTIVERFNTEVQSFYDSEDISRGFITAIDRNGIATDFPLMTVCAAAIRYDDVNGPCKLEELSNVLASLKKQAKKAGIVWLTKSSSS
ncbi:MAG: GGDEF domain-containing protein [Spirochaetia bacterium]|nr:GGDEF domain-containing protein [Spirochaetia bacterium]MCF7941153.1 GGDEF domain-containing protein [Spirochaetia bacterium]